MRSWQLCGPLGGPGFEKLTTDPNGLMPGTRRDWKEVTRELCEAAASTGPFGRSEFVVYWGADSWLLGQAHGSALAVGDDRAPGCSCDRRDGRTGLLRATWIHVPDDMVLELGFQGHLMTVSLVRQRSTY